MLDNEIQTVNNLFMKDSMANFLKTLLKIFLVIVAVVIVINIMSFFTIVNPGERGLLVQFGTVQGIYEPGLHFQMPILNKVIMKNPQPKI